MEELGLTGEGQRHRLHVRWYRGLGGGLVLGKGKGEMAEHLSQVVSTQPSHRVAFQETTWDQVQQPGAYVEKGSGVLYRIPQEGLGPGSPLIAKQSLGPSHLVRISGNPFITTREARMLCAEGNIQPNF
jgi:hypothetical protein